MSVLASVRACKRELPKTRVQIPEETWTMVRGSVLVITTVVYNPYVYLVVAALALLADNDPSTSIPSDAYTGVYHLESKPERKIELDVDYEAKVPDGTCRGWVLVIPVAPETGAQREVSTAIEPSEIGRLMKKARELSPLGRPTLRSEISTSASSVKMKVVYRATMWSRRLSPGPSSEKVPDLSVHQRSLYTRPTITCNFEDSKVANWIERLGLLRHKTESELAFAYRAFVAVHSQFPYASPDKGSEWSKCSTAVERGSADCGASNLLLSAVLRSNRIPARVFCGRHALVGIGESGGDTSHSRMEFFAFGVGWVPADATMPAKRGDTKDNAFLFGLDPGWYLADHEETDLVIPLPECGDQTLTWAHQYLVPYRTQGISSWDNFNLTEHVKCHNLEMIGTGWYAHNSVRK